MIYSKLYLEKKNNLLPLFIVTGIVLFASIVTFFSTIPVRVKKITDARVIRMEVVNISDSAVGIFWETEKQESGWVEYRTENAVEGQIALDERDVLHNKNPFFFHFVSIKDLKPETTYTFNIVTEKGRYVANNTTEYHFKTSKKDDQTNRLKPAYGKVYSQNGKAADSTLVLLKIKGIYPLMALTKQTGEWLIPFNRLINKETGLKTDTINENSPVEMEFLSETGGRSYAKTLVSHVSPLSQGILLGRNYSLLKNDGEVLSASDTNTGDTPLSFSVIYPRENALIPASKPLLKGIGIPRKDVFVFINSKPQFAFRTTVDEDGEWRILPRDPIGPGTYLAVFTTVDEKGRTITVKRQFMIAKSGEQVLGTATGAPTLIPTQPATPTKTISPPATITPLLPSVTPIMTYPTPSPTKEPPRTGGGSMGGVFGIALGMLILGSGLLLVF